MTTKRVILGLFALGAIAISGSATAQTVRQTKLSLDDGSGNITNITSPASGTLLIPTLRLTNPLGGAYGGTGLTSITNGAILLGSTGNTMTQLAGVVGDASKVLQWNGTAWVFSTNALGDLAYQNSTGLTLQNLHFDNAADHTIDVNASAAATAGHNLTIAAGAGTGAAGGNLSLNAGTGTARGTVNITGASLGLSDGTNTSTLLPGTSSATITFPSATGTLATTSTGTANTLAKYSSAGNIANSSVTDNGTTFSVNGKFSVTESTGDLSGASATFAKTNSTSIGAFTAPTSPLMGTWTGGATVGPVIYGAGVYGKGTGTNDDWTSGVFGEADASSGRSYGGLFYAHGGGTNAALGLINTAGNATTGIIPTSTVDISINLPSTSGTLALAGANTDITSLTGLTGAVSGATTITASTSVTDPLLIGSTSANGTLTLEGNSAAAGNTATNANMVFKVGNSAGTTAMTIKNNGDIDMTAGTTTINNLVAPSFTPTNITFPTDAVPTTRNINVTAQSTAATAGNAIAITGGTGNTTGAGGAVTITGGTGGASGTGGNVNITSGTGTSNGNVNLTGVDVNVTGNLKANGANTAGSVVFVGASGQLTQNNSQLFWNNTTNRLGVNTATPGSSLANVSTNYLYNDGGSFGDGVNSSAIDWSVSGNGFAASIGNSSSSAGPAPAGPHPNGLGVNVANQTVNTVAFHVGSGASGSSTKLFEVLGNGDVSVAPTQGNVSIGGGSGTFALNSSNIDISSAGAITGATGVSSTTVTASTSITDPLLIGSTSANGTLTLEGNNTTGNTGTNSNIVFKVGDNAATTAMTIKNNGDVTMPVGTTTVNNLSVTGTFAPTDLVFPSNGPLPSIRNVKVEDQAVTDGIGNPLAVTGGKGNGENSGGYLSLTGGAAGAGVGAGLTGGLVSITGGAGGTTAGIGGDVNITGGTGTNHNGDVNISGRNVNLTSTGTTTFNGPIDFNNQTVTNLSVSSGAISAGAISLAQNNILVGSALNKATAYAPVVSSILTTTGAGVPTWSTTLPAFSTTAVTSPSVIGSTAANGSLSLTASSNATNTGTAMTFNVGNLGATTAMTINHSGVVTIPNLNITGSFSGDFNLTADAAHSIGIVQSTTGNGQTLTIQGESTTNATSNGGNVVINGGDPGTGGNYGNVQLNSNGGYTEFKGRVVMDYFTAAAAASIDLSTWNQSIIVVTNSVYAGNITFASMPATATNGQVLYIVNQDGDADVTGTFNVPRASKAMYVYIAGTWTLVL